MVLTVLLTTAAFAAPISQEEALRKASAFVANRHHTQSHKMLKAARRQPGTKLTSTTGDAYYYVFNIGENEGFVIVSGDDRALPILGYSDKGSFDAQAMPEPVKAWFEGYAHQLRQLQASGVQSPNQAPISRSSIAPLLTTQWNQHEPYNNDCPKLYNGTLTITGCVPTAMAQLMYYHRWPAATTAAIPDYDTPTKWGEYGAVHVSGFPANTTFEWDKMKDIFSADLPENEPDRTQAIEEQKAISKLMRVCGTAVQADYRDLGNGGTGAEDAMAVTALIKYFDYSALIRKLSRNDYMYAEWQELIYSELQASRPVIYGGQSSGGGHFFVVDGFEGGLFHINWGWGGFCDGYYVLSVANPGSNEGAGASATLDGYGLDQVAIVGIKKNEGEKPTDIHMSSSIVGTSGNQMTSSYINKNAGDYRFDLGIGYAQADGTFKLVGSAYTTEAPLGTGWGYNSFPFEVKGLPDGVYHLVPISRVAGTEKWLPNCNAKRDYVKATVSGSSVTLEWIQPTVNLSVTSFTCPGKHKIGRRQTVDVAVKNSGDEYYGPLFFFVGSGSTVKLTAYTGVTLETGETATTTFTFDPQIAGDNTLIVALDQECSKIIGQTTLNIKPQGETGEHLSVTALKFDNDNTTDWTVPEFEGKITVTNAGTEEFDGELFLRIYYNAEGRWGNYSYLKDAYFEATVPAGATVDVPFKVEGLTPGVNYWPMVCVGESIIWRTSGGEDIRRYEPDLDAVEAIEADHDDAWFTLSGLRVDQPRRGIYVRNGKKVVVK